MYSSRMRTARSLTVSCSIPSILGGGLPNPHGCIFPPSGCRPLPQMQTPWIQTPSPGCRPHPLDADPPSQCMLESQHPSFLVHAGKPAPPFPLHAWKLAPPVNKMTDKCKNITFANFVCGQ